MTEFERRGHYRTSKRGELIYVQATQVRRDNWRRNTSGGYDTAPAVPLPTATRPIDSFLVRYPEFVSLQRVSACFINPNATCPVCGQGVYYYQNELGSRVFFDELGPPWPKHSCTDTRLNSAPSYEPQFGLTFRIRSQAQIAEIMAWRENRSTGFESAFVEQYGTNPWPLATIVRRLKGDKRVFVVATPIKDGRPRKIYLSCKSLPKCCKKGFLIALGKRTISFIDTKTLAAMEVPITRHRGAGAFLDAMDDAEIDER